jgi:hypothetical protein
MMLEPPAKKKPVVSTQAGSETVMSRPLLARIINPGVQWWVAVPCNILAGAALVALAIDSERNLTAALCLLGPAPIALYGTALANWYRRKPRS